MSTTPAPVEFKFNREELLKKLNAIVEYQEQFAGLPNHNPFLWIHKNLQPLYNRLSGYKDENTGKSYAPEATKELHDSIMALTEVKPIINHELHKVQEQEKPKIVLTPGGAVVASKPEVKK